MDLPSTRELELETLLRQRDAQLLELTDEVTQLRQYLSTQPGPSTSDSLSLPPAFVSLLLPHITGGVGSHSTSPSSSTTVTAALTQRTKVLQEENDELYELLKSGETGKLKEEVRGLRRVVDRLEKALKESHQVIISLSTELDKSYEALSATNPRLQHHQTNNNNNYNSSGSRHGSNGASPKLGSKPPPTGPRAYKKQRLSDPANRVGSRKHVDKDHERDSVERERKPNTVKMEIDDDERPRSRSRSGERGHEWERDRERERDRDRHRGRTRDNERDRTRGPERERERGYGRRGHGTYQSGDRTLAERIS